MTPTYSLVLFNIYENCSILKCVSRGKTKVTLWKNTPTNPLDTGNCWSSLVPFSVTRRLESQQNWPIYNPFHTDEITESVDHQISPWLFFCPDRLWKTNWRVWLCLTSLLGWWAAIQNLKTFSSSPVCAICTALFWSPATRSLQIELKFALHSICSLETCTFQD